MSNYGKGSITWERGKARVRVPNGKGGHKTIGYYDTREEAELMRRAALLERAAIGAVGTTLRQYGPLFLGRIKHQRNYRMWENTWNNIVLEAPFADLPVAVLEDGADVEEWAAGLLDRRKRRMVVVDGQRTTIELAETISRQTAKHALGLLRRALQMAWKRDKLISSNPAAGVVIPKIDREDEDGEIIIGERLTYLCEDEVRALVGFQQLPLEQRTVFVLGVCQGPREGELAGMDWERIDWGAHGWWIARSWKGRTKNGKVRWQTLLPIAAAALRAWWEHCGRPTQGIVFPSHQGRSAPKGQRRRASQQRPPAPPKRYARGYDWGWADHPEKHLTRLGWWRRAGIKTRVRFHDLRDTCATHLLSGTWGEPWTMEQVSRHIGHSSVKITEQRYAHLTRESQRKAALSLNMEKRPAENLPQLPAPSAVQVVEIASVPGPIRTVDLRLRKPWFQAETPQETGRGDPMRQLCGRFAAELLERTAADEPLSAAERTALMENLARAVLAAIPEATLALSVLAGGEHAFEQALQLASIAHGWADAAAAPEANGGRP